MSKKTAANARTSTPMTPTAASRIQAATARTNGGVVASGTFAARAQSAAAANTAAQGTAK